MKNIKKYHLYRTIQFLYGARLLIALIGTFILIFGIGPENWVKKLSTMLFSIVYLTLTFIIFKLLRKIPKRKLDIEINHKFLEFEIQNIFYVTTKKQFYWDDIVSYSEDIGQGFYVFKLKSRSEKIRFVIDTSDHDSYQEFYRYFVKKIDKLKLNIEREKSLHEKQGGLYYAIILGVLLVLYTVIGIHNNRFNWGLFTPLLSGTLFFSYKVYLYQKNKNELDV